MDSPRANGGVAREGGTPLTWRAGGGGGGGPVSARRPGTAGAVSAGGAPDRPRTPTPTPAARPGPGSQPACPAGCQGVTAGLPWGDKLLPRGREESAPVPHRAKRLAVGGGDRVTPVPLWDGASLRAVG